MPVTERRCYACKTVKPISEFYPSKRHGHQYECKPCTRAYKTKYRKENREKITAYFKDYKAKNRERIRESNRKHAKANPHVHRDYILRKVYGISLEKYNEMLGHQDGCCAVCRHRSKLNVDHCHTTGAVRGLLCTNCNQGIGRLMDSPKLLRAAAAYLENTASQLRNRASG